MATYRKKPVETRQDWTGVAPKDSQWTAIDADTYDGPGSPIGSGATQAEAISDLREKMRTPLEHGAPAYTIRVERKDCVGRVQHFEFDGYGVLRELMDDIEAEADRRGWFSAQCSCPDPNIPCEPGPAASDQPGKPATCECYYTECKWPLCNAPWRGATDVS